MSYSYVRKNEIFKESEHGAEKTDYDTARTFRYPGESWFFTETYSRGLGENGGNCQRKSAGIKFMLLMVILTFSSLVKVKGIIAYVDFWSVLKC